MRYNGTSTDNISRYLKLRDQEEKRKGNKYRRNGLQNRNSNHKMTSTSPKDDEMENWSVNWRHAGHKTLSEGERKLCNVLKVKPKDLHVIKREIGARIRRHGLLSRCSTPNQIWIDIGDVKKVKETMTTKIGL